MIPILCSFVVWFSVSLHLPNRLLLPPHLCETCKIVWYHNAKARQSVLVSLVTTVQHWVATIIWELLHNILSCHVTVTSHKTGSSRSVWSHNTEFALKPVFSCHTTLWAVRQNHSVYSACQTTVVDTTKLEYLQPTRTGDKVQKPSSTVLSW